MKMLMRNIKIILVLFLVLSISLLSGLFFQQNRSKNELMVAAGENKDSLQSIYALAGSINDRSGYVLAQSVDGERIYADDPDVAEAMLQIVGDYTHNIENTIEANYQSVLLGTDRNAFNQFVLDFQGKGLSGDDVTLTIDADISAQAYDLLDGRKGSVVLLNYETGDIIAAVSSPSTTPESVITYTDIPDTALFNRAFSGQYAPGSTFKIITAAAYISSPIFDPDYVVHCNGESTVSDYGASESGDGHGDVYFARAFSKSCNVYFGEIGVAVGKDLLFQTAEDFGFGTDISVDRLSVADGCISIPDDVSAISWLSIGQPIENSTLYTSPLHLAMIAGAIANDGIMVTPHIIDHFTTPNGYEYGAPEETTLLRAVSSDTAQEIESLMIDVVLNGTGTNAAISGYTVAAKTGTVQVDGQENNALCVAYIVDDDMTYAVAVIVEEGGAGSVAAAPIASSILSAAISSNMD